MPAPSFIQDGKKNKTHQPQNQHIKNQSTHPHPIYTPPTANIP